MKKVYIAIIALILVLVIALLAFKLTTPKVNIESMDADSRYAYSYVEDKKGLSITIEGELSDGSYWQPFVTSGRVDVTAKNNGKKAKASTFIIQPKSVGSDRVCFNLMDSEGASSYEIYCELFVDSDNSIAVMSNYHREVEGIKTLESSTVSVKAVANTDGSVRIFFKGEGCTDWSLDYQHQYVNAYWESENFEESERVLLITYKDYGFEQVKIIDEETDEYVLFNIYTDLHRNVVIDDCVAVDAIR